VNGYLIVKELWMGHLAVGSRPVDRGMGNKSDGAIER
jgi:hypothetical protein